MTASSWLLENTGNDKQLMGNISVDNLMMMGYLTGGWLIAKSALKANQLSSEDNKYGTDFLQAKVFTADFFADHYLPRVGQHAETILSGLRSTFSIDIDQL